MGCASSHHSTPASEPILKSPETFHDRYLLGPKLAEGTFGQVCSCTKMCRWEHDQPVWRGLPSLDFAVKIVETSAMSGSSSNLNLVQDRKDTTDREWLVWQHVGSCAHVVRLQEVFLEQDCSYFVMERCSGGSLLQGLVDDRFTDTGEFVQIFREMLYGIRHLHMHGVIHRDVKPDNFVLGAPCGAANTDQYISRHSVVKLCDFGTAEFICNLPVPNVRIHGTAPYTSPEMLKRVGYDEKTDIWSCGVAAFLMLYGHYPYNPENSESRDTRDMRDAVRKGKPMPDYKTAEGYSVIKPTGPSEAFVRALLNRDPVHRPCAKQALQFPFLHQAKDVSQEVASKGLLKPRRRFSARSLAPVLVSFFSKPIGTAMRQRSDEATRQHAKSAFTLSSRDSNSSAGGDVVASVHLAKKPASVFDETQLETTWVGSDTHPAGISEASSYHPDLDGQFDVNGVKAFKIAL